MTIAKLPSFILASSSPRRLQLLQQIGLPVRVMPSQINEQDYYSALLTPAEFVERVALAKAQSVADRVQPEENCIVIGADTIVVLDNRIIGKPKSAEGAVSILRDLSGRCHQVYTAVALLEIGGHQRQSVNHTCSQVWLREIPPAAIEAYVATGEPMDKAGAYAVQGLASIFVEKIEGCYFNVVGLPLSTLATMLESWGIPIQKFWPRHTSSS